LTLVPAIIAEALLDRRKLPVEMNSTQIEPTAPASAPEANTCRWDGHMSDGIGSTYGPAPLAHLSAGPEYLVLTGTRGNFLLPRSVVIKLGKGGLYPWFFRGIRIRHRIASFPEELLFKPMGIRERDILARLRELGYPVS
jgi:hypothetical protein